MNRMAERARGVLTQLTREESGHGTLTIVLTLLIGGALILAPILAFTIGGINSGQAMESRMHEYYAADAAIQEGLWRIHYDRLPDWMDGVWDEEVYAHPGAEYTVTGGINGKSVTYTIQAIWALEGLEQPSSWQERTPPDMLEGDDKLELAMATEVIGSGTSKISIVFDGDLTIDRIGVWLSQGFDYVNGSSTFEQVEEYSPLYCQPDICDHGGGTAIKWDNWNNTSTPPDIPLSLLPEMGGSRVVQFEFTPGDDSPSSMFSWMVVRTGGKEYLCWDVDVKFYNIESQATTVDTGKSTLVNTYMSMEEFRKHGGAVQGDYFAMGGTLMTATGSGSDIRFRNRLFKESSAIIGQDDIPLNATIKAAWLYWSGWIEEASQQVIVFEDDCADFNDWIPGSDWGIASGSFRGHHIGNDPDRALKMHTDQDLSAYSGQSVTISWQQWENGDLESDDCLRYAFSNDGGSTWGNWNPAFCNDIGSSPTNFSTIIPEAYLTSTFRMRFSIAGFADSGWWSGDEYCYIDNLQISTLVAGVEGAKVNRVIFNDTQVTADAWQVEPNADVPGAPDSWSYSCFYDATGLVKQLIDLGEIGTNGSGTYTVGHWLEDGPESYTLYSAETGLPVGTTGYPLAPPATKTGYSYPSKYEWTYAGWSIIIIYSSPQTKGHQLYFFDDLHYVPNLESMEFPVAGFLAPDSTDGSHLTCFVGEGDNHYGCGQGGWDDQEYIEVNGTRLGDATNPQCNVWNSYSNCLDNPFLNGIDIDTFDMSHCINPGDSSADVVLGTGYDSYNLVYVILSFTSETTSGGVLSYTIGVGS